MARTANKNVIGNGTKPADIHVQEGAIIAAVRVPTKNRVYHLATALDLRRGMDRGSANSGRLETFQYPREDIAQV